MHEEMLTDIERINVIVLAVGCMAAAIIMREFKYVFSFGVGSAIMTLNFRFLRKGVEGIIQNLQQGGAAEQNQPAERQLIRRINRKAFIVKLPLKFLALVTAVTLVILYGDIQVVFFLVGLSTVFISVLLSYVSSAFKPVDERSKQHGA
jgi:uncharacterized membrane protein YoaK (UPF0700 family)